LEFRLTGIRDQVEGILPKVSKPARYIGGELGEVKKDHADVQVLFALAFPDVYEVGMSNLGLKVLYHTLNRRDDTAAERVFAPNADMEAEMRGAGIPLYALESFAPVRDFDIIGFSLSYELTYTNVLNMLDLAGLPPRSSDRDESYPLVIAGGHCTANPEPMAEFIDAFVIGDGEEVVHKIVEAYKENCTSRTKLLCALAQIEGVYVPRFYAAGQALCGSVPDRVRRAVVTDLEAADFPDTTVVPFIETIHDRAALEIMRGCTRTCRFCQAGMITRPIRERSTEKLKEQAEALTSSTGYDEIGLMSLSSADYSNIQPLVHDLIDKYEPDRVGVSLPSIRADSGCVRFAAEIQRVRKTGLTFAPEAGTQRLRDVINKNVTEGDLLDAIDTAVSCGWRKVKLYFMVGLPTETDEDVAAIGDLVRKVLGVAKERRRPLTINVGVSSFVPKPHTPFQWRGQDPREELHRKIGILRNELRIRNVSLSWHDTEMSELEAVMAKGGRELGPAILRAWELGAKFDGWDDQFDMKRWREAFEETEVDFEAIAHERIAYEEPLPWEQVDCGVTRHWLEVQDRLADNVKPTEDCRFGTCLNCGIKEFLAEKTGDGCPLDLPEPVAVDAAEGSVAPQALDTATDERPTVEPVRAWYMITYAKGRNLRWISHMDLVRTFERAVKRARLPVAYSEGFNPRVRMSFYTQLAVGLTGEAEPMIIELTERVNPKDLACAMNSTLPAGISIRSIEEVDGRRGPEIHGSEYLIGVVGACNGDLDAAAKALLAAESIVVERRKETETKPVEIRPGVEKLEVLHGAVHDDCTGLIRAWLAGVRPSELVDGLSRSVSGIEMRFAHRVRVY
jgi:radical SAM family uncharacterized protein/radical SAM-linked protein